MKSYWTLRVFCVAFTGSIVFYLVDPFGASKPGDFAPQATNSIPKKVGANHYESESEMSTIPTQIGASDTIVEKSMLKTKSKALVRGDNHTSFHQKPTIVPTTTIAPKLEEHHPQEPRLCQLFPAPVFGKERQRLWWGQENHPLRILRIEYFRYRCAGKPYDDFMEHHLLPYIRQTQLSNLKWGKRPFLLPESPNEARPRKILFLGNSHTLQMVGALLCQFHQHINKSRLLEKGIEDAIEYRMQNNVTVYSVFNHGSLYSRRWKKNLGDVLGWRLGRMDAIVLGHINDYDPQYDNTNLWGKIKRYGEDHPEYEVDVARYPKGVEFLDLAAQYQGPIIWVPMTAVTNQPQHEQVVRQMKNITQTTGRTNLQAVNARQHVAGMNRAECGSDSSSTIGTCFTNRAGFVYSNGHRCMGDKGGEPDIVAYDVVEALFQAFSVEGEF